MVSHRSLRTPAITRITVVLIPLVVLTYPYSLGQAQNRIPTDVPWGGFGGSARKGPAGIVTDGFKAFDALAMAAQIKSLRKDGPHEEQQQNTSDTSFRVLVRGGDPLVVDYALEPGAVGELTITVPKAKPLIVKMDATPDTQLRITIPSDFGADQVAKLRITARTKDNQPANIQVNRIAGGPNGVNALRRTMALDSEVQLAAIRYGPLPAVSNEPVRLFAPALQLGSSPRINVSPPTTIKARKKPPLTFSFTSRSNFSGGRWELQRAKGLDRTHVWQKKTGPISANRPNSDSWDGTDSAKKDSLGYHVLVLVVWNGRESDYSWVLARARPNLIVTK